MELSKEELIRLAMDKGICRAGAEQMERLGPEELVGYYVTNPDWCLERDFPDLRMLSDSFADCEEHGVFVNREFHGELLNDLQTYIFHHCRGTVRVGLNVDKGIIPMLYLANGCRLRIVGAGDVVPPKPSARSVVPVYVFGKSDVSARDNRYVRFNRYNNDVK